MDTVVNAHSSSDSDHDAQMGLLEKVDKEAKLKKRRRTNLTGSEQRQVSITIFIEMGMMTICMPF